MNVIIEILFYLICLNAGVTIGMLIPTRPMRFEHHATKDES